MNLSIALATINGAAYLKEQLEGFAAQTRTPDELVISDDQSTDDTLRLNRRIAATARFRCAFSQRINLASLRT